MKPADLVREAVFPLTDLTIILAIAVFGSMLWLTSILLQLGPLFLILGLLFAFAVIPALFRYGVYLLEARAHGMKSVVADIETFSIFDNMWALFPLLLLLGVSWLGVLAGARLGPSYAQVLTLLLFLVYPASMAVLAVTHSPLASVNPVSLFRMINSCGWSYVWVPLVLTIVFLVIRLVAGKILPGYALFLLGTYNFFLLFTLTGAVVHASGVAARVDIGAPVEKTESEVADDLAAERQKVLNHAYGFVSRGNREGGFRHVRQRIESEPDADGAVMWFFNEMMKWEIKDAALFFGQECFAHFLHHEQDTVALKLASRCLYEDPQWKPKPEDRQHAIEVAERYGMNDLVNSFSD